MEKAKPGCTAKSPSQPAGIIETNTLDGALGKVEKAEAPRTETGEDLKPVVKADGFTTLEAECIAPVKGMLEGSVIGEVAPVGGPAKRTGELFYECEPARSDHQKIKLFEGIKGIITFFGSEACFESIPDRLTFEEPLEVT